MLKSQCATAGALPALRVQATPAGEYGRNHGGDGVGEDPEVQRLTAQLDALSRRADGTQRKGPLSRRCETALAEPFDATTHPELVGQRAELARGLSELDAVLDEHFRVPAVPITPSGAL